jgi:glycosyltransferase involved in cell wall biosynthesis
MGGSLAAGPAPANNAPMPGPRLDVLLPVRLARRTLPWAVRDVLAQRDVRVRLLAVVDTGPGGADDGSRAWLAASARRDRRVHVLDGPGRGVGAALDLALQHVTAPLVAHMEADDRSAPDRLARQAAALEADPSLSGVTCRVAQSGARTPGMRRYLDWQNALTGHAAMAAERFIEIPALHQTGVYRAAALRAIGGYAPRGAWPADIDAWLRWFEHDAQVAPLRLAKLPRVLYRWRQHPGQSTRGGGTHAAEALRACKLHYLARLVGRQAPQPRRVLLLSTGATLAAWHAGLPPAGIELAGAHDWRPGQPAPRVPDGALVLGVYGMPPARARLRAALGAPREPDELLFAG